MIFKYEYKTHTSKFYNGKVCAISNVFLVYGLTPRSTIFQLMMSRNRAHRILWWYIFFMGSWI